MTPQPPSADRATRRRLSIHHAALVKAAQSLSDEYQRAGAVVADIPQMFVVMQSRDLTTWQVAPLQCDAETALDIIQALGAGLPPGVTVFDEDDPEHSARYTPEPELPPMLGVVAAADLGERSGATGFDVGYRNETPPAQWWATCTYLGAKLIGEDDNDPEAACDALAREILHGGLCTNCGRSVHVGPADPAPGRCVWVRYRDRWSGSCQ